MLYRKGGQRRHPRQNHITRTADLFQRPNQEHYPHPSNIASQDARKAFRNSTNVGSAGKYSPASKLCT